MTEWQVLRGRHGRLAPHSSSTPRWPTKAVHKTNTTVLASMASAAVAPPTPAATASVGAPSVSASTSASAQSAPAAPVAATTAAVCNSSLDEQIERLRRCEYLREGEVKALCLRAREILVDESNVQRVDAPVTVSEQCGMVQHMYAVVHCCFHVVSRPTVVGRDLHAKTHPYYHCRVVSSSSLLF